MTDQPTIDVSRVLPEGAAGTLTRPEADAILEVTFLAAVARDDLSEDQEFAFRDVMGALRTLVGPEAGAKDVEDDDVEAAIDGFAAKLDDESVVERLVALAPNLQRSVAKHAAYKVAFAMDLLAMDEDADEDDAFEDELLEALGIDDSEADTLATEALSVLGVEFSEDDEEEDLEHDEEFEDDDEFDEDEDEDDLGDDDDEDDQDDEDA